jgi:spore maturation protein A
MNILFSAVFIFCALFLLCQSPDTFLAALLEGGAKGATTCVALLSSYAVWLGLIRVWEDCGIAKRVARFVKPIARKLLKTKDEEALSAVSMNISVNLLGISGAATPYGVTAARLLDKSPNAEYASCMFFVLNATSLQIIPASVVGIRAALGSVDAANVILPTFLTSLFSTLLAALLTRLLIPPKSNLSPQPSPLSTPFAVQKTKGAGI